MPKILSYRPIRVRKKTTAWIWMDAVDVRDGTPVHVVQIPRFAYFHEAFRQKITRLLELWSCLPTVGVLRPLRWDVIERDLYLIYAGEPFQPFEYFFAEVPVFPWPVAVRIVAECLRYVHLCTDRLSEELGRPVRHGRIALSTCMLHADGQVSIVPPLVHPEFRDAYAHLVPWTVADDDPVATAPPPSSHHVDSDRFYLGVLLYFLLTGARPWVEDEDGTLLTSLWEPLHVHMPWLPLPLNGIVYALLTDTAPLWKQVYMELTHLSDMLAWPPNPVEREQFYRDPLETYRAYRLLVREWLRRQGFQAIRRHRDCVALWYHETLAAFDVVASESFARTVWLEELRARCRAAIRTRMGMQPNVDAGADPSGLLREKQSLAYPVWTRRMENALWQGAVLDAWQAWLRLRWNRSPIAEPAGSVLQDLHDQLVQSQAVGSATPVEVPVIPASHPTARRSPRWRHAVRGVVAILLLGIGWGIVRWWSRPASVSPPPPLFPETVEVPIMPPTCERSAEELRRIEREMRTAARTGDWVVACDRAIQLLACTPESHPAYRKRLQTARRACARARTSFAPSSGVG